MVEFLSKFNAGQLIGLIAVAGGLTIGLTCGVAAIIGAFWESVRKTEVSSRLVQDMLDRGMPHDEIVEVVLAVGVEAPEKALAAAQAHRREECAPAEPHLT